MSDANGWPDASKPGVPMNPERDGWHLIGLAGDEIPMRWRSHEKCWGVGIIPESAAKSLRYISALTTPQEAHHRERAAAAAAWLAARDACVRACNFHGDTLTQHWLSASGVPVTRACATILANLSPPSDAAAALAEVVKQARAEEREAILSQPGILTVNCVRGTLRCMERERLEQVLQQARAEERAAIRALIQEVEFPDGGEHEHDACGEYADRIAAAIRARQGGE